MLFNCVIYSRRLFWLSLLLLIAVSCAKVCFFVLLACQGCETSTLGEEWLKWHPPITARSVLLASQYLWGFLHALFTILLHHLSYRIGTVGAGTGCCLSAHIYIHNIIQSH